MNLAQSFGPIQLNPSFLESLAKLIASASPFVLLVFLVVAFIWLINKLNSNTARNADTTQKVVEVQQTVAESKVADNQTFIDAISSLTKIVLAQQGRMDKYDTTVDLMAKGIDKQNDLLDAILGDQRSSNEWQRKLYAEIIEISGDQSTAITAVGQTVTETVKGSEALIMSRLDGMPERVASRLTPALATQHSETLQVVKVTGKSIEDLFNSIISENKDLKETIELKTQENTSLSTRLQEVSDAKQVIEAELNHLKALVAPSDYAVLPPDDKPPEPTPPSPVLLVDGDTGDVLKEKAA